MHEGCRETFGKRKNARAADECIFTLSESRPTSQLHYIIHDNTFRIYKINYISHLQYVAIFGLSLNNPHNIHMCGIYGIMFQRYQLTEYYRAYFNNINSPLFSKLCMLPWDEAALSLR